MVGSSDELVPYPADAASWQVDPAIPGSALLDARLSLWIEQYGTSPLRVLAAESDRCSGVVLRLSEGYALEVFTASTSDSAGQRARARNGEGREQWRLFRPADDSSHFVITDLGIEGDGS